MSKHQTAKGWRYVLARKTGQNAERLGTFPTAAEARQAAEGNVHESEASTERGQAGKVDA